MSGTTYEPVNCSTCQHWQRDGKPDSEPKLCPILHYGYETPIKTSWFQVCSDHSRNSTDNAGQGGEK